MKALVVALSFFLVCEAGYGSACCAGGNAKSFISLQRLQKYEIGISTLARDVYARYNLYGELEETDKNRTYGVSVGAGVRVTEDIQLFSILPLVHQQNRLGKNATTRTSVGDVLLGGQFTLVESMFQDEWFPTVNLAAGLKLPTGVIETGAVANRIPGTGNGLWEPFVGLGFRKEYGFATLAANATYTVRVNSGARDKIEEGNKFDLLESVTIPFSRRFSLGLGSTQAFSMERSVNGNKLKDSEGRTTSLFVTPTYFLTQFWSMTATFDVSVPMGTFGRNEQASTTASVTTKYGFY